MATHDSDIVIPEILPLLPIRDVVIFPFMFLPLFVEERLR
jgi:ATP-dependent Lon protease